MQRRHFIYAGAAAGIGGTLALLFRERERAHSALPTGVADLDQDPEGLLDLPEGFHYEVLERAGQPMSDGLVVPHLADGMACFDDGQGHWVLMRNHEIDLGMHGVGAFARGAPRSEHDYDPRAAGGVSRVVIDPASGKRLSSNLVLSGSARNCAGGPSPWGWLSCEESESPGHGYVFLCDVGAAHVQPPKRIDAYGRFNHEAVAIDPHTGAAYLSEDKVDACFYRMRPNDPARPFEGALEAMVLDADVDPDTGRLPVGRDVPVHWKRVPNPRPEPHEAPTRVQAQQSGAAIVRRGEGVWYHDGSVFFTATIGGPSRGGQIFELRLAPTGDTLRVLAQSESAAELDMPDNLSVGPGGGLFVCEDGAGANYLRHVSRDGRVTPFARNALSGSELAGVCFSPDGRTMFVNLQHDGLTLAVTGPFAGLDQA